jgi:hypothetical protein
MKTFLQIIAWIGAGLVALGTVVVFLALIFGVGGVDFAHPIAIFLAIVGVPLMLIGGLIGRPKYFWLASIIVSASYFIAFSPLIEDLVSKIQYTERDWLFRNGWLFRQVLQDVGPLVLGLIGVGEGVFMRRSETRGQAKAKKL